MGYAGGESVPVLYDEVGGVAYGPLKVDSVDTIKLKFLLILSTQGLWGLLDCVQTTKKV